MATEGRDMEQGEGKIDLILPAMILVISPVMSLTCWSSTSVALSPNIFAAIFLPSSPGSKGPRLLAIRQLCEHIPQACHPYPEFEKVFR